MWATDDGPMDDLNLRSQRRYAGADIEKGHGDLRRSGKRMDGALHAATGGTGAAGIVADR